MEKTAGARRDRDRPQPAPRSPVRGAGKRVTMTDVARLAACSQSTVSVVLNNTPGIRISKETRERVIKVAEQLGYEIIPGHAALSDRPPRSPSSSTGSPPAPRRWSRSMAPARWRG
jgi:LacI family transcriptional regulator